MIADLGLGSNLGDRAGHLQTAIDSLAAQGCRVVAVSGVYETDPVGGPDQGRFLNAVVRVETALDPDGLLALAQSIEADAARVRTIRWGPRTLDVDVLRCRHGDVEVVSDDPGLCLPHPRMWERAFVLVPLAEIDAAVELGGVDTTGVTRTDLTLRP